MINKIALLPLVDTTAFVVLTIFLLLYHSTTCEKILISAILDRWRSVISIRMQREIVAITVSSRASRQGSKVLAISVEREGLRDKSRLASKPIVPERSIYDYRHQSSRHIILKLQEAYSKAASC
jgi:hypothetical protein